MKNTIATRQLPEGYREIKELDLSKEFKTSLLLSIASLVLFFVFGLLFLWLFQVLRPSFIEVQSGFSIIFFDRESPFMPLLVWAGIIFGMIFLHEAIHGLFFWLFTGDRPKFGFKIVYAFAGAPDWYITKFPYLIIGLSPFVILTILGFIIALIAPAAWLLPLLLFITMNASGAVGDIYAVFWLLFEPDNILIQDFGDKVKVYVD